MNVETHQLSLCVYLCLSSRDLSIFSVRVSIFVLSVLWYFPFPCGTYYIIDTSNPVNFVVAVILAKSHYLLYALTAAMHPRWLVTLDENMEPVSVSVRVGQVCKLERCKWFHLSSSEFVILTCH